MALGIESYAIVHDIELLLSRELVTVVLQDQDEPRVVEDTRMQVWDKFLSSVASVDVRA